MKKLSLDKTWELCLKMWKWIAEQEKEGNEDCVETLKEKWLKDNGFDPGTVSAACFFCEYNKQRAKIFCRSCPGKLVDKEFDCQDIDYDYSYNPIAFYEKLVSLNKERLRRKRK